MGGGSVNAPARKPPTAACKRHNSSSSSSCCCSDDDWVDVGVLFAKTESAPEDEDSLRLEDNVEDADDDDDGPLLEENLHDTGVAHCDGGPGDSDDELLLEPNVACSRVNAGDLDDDNQDRDEPTLELNIAPAKVCATVDKEANAKVAI